MRKSLRNYKSEFFLCFEIIDTALENTRVLKNGQPYHFANFIAFPRISKLLANGFIYAAFQLPESAHVKRRTANCYLFRQFILGLIVTSFDALRLIHPCQAETEL